MSKRAIIGLVMKSLQAEFFQEMKKGAIEFSHKQESFNLITVGTNNQTEIEKQIELIDALILQRVDALVVVPIDSKALIPVVVKAVKAGIKVINIDIRLDQELLQQIGIELTYVGPDNETASYMVAKEMKQKLKKGAKIIMIEGLSVAENAQQRKQGFMRAIDECGFELLASAPADWETNKAAHVFENLYKSYPDVDGVMCCNDAMALGVISILEKYGKTIKIPVVGFDNDASVQPLLKNGKMLATIDAYGSQMAVQGIEYALRVLNGMENKGSFSTKFDLVTA